MQVPNFLKNIIDIDDRSVLNFGTWVKFTLMEKSALFLIMLRSNWYFLLIPNRLLNKKLYWF